MARRRSRCFWCEVTFSAREDWCYQETKGFQRTTASLKRSRSRLFLTVASAIDRMFGLHLAIINLTDVLEAAMIEKHQTFCRLCGYKCPICESSLLVAERIERLLLAPDWLRSRHAVTCGCKVIRILVSSMATTRYFRWYSVAIVARE
jgi:hypothetical protein